MSMATTIKLGSTSRTAVVDGHEFNLNAMTKQEENKFRRLLVEAFRIKQQGAK